MGSGGALGSAPGRSSCGAGGEPSPRRRWPPFCGGVWRALRVCRPPLVLLILLLFPSPAPRGTEGAAPAASAVAREAEAAPARPLWQPPPQGAALSRRPAAGFPACRRAGNARPQAPGALPGFALSLFCSLPRSPQPWPPCAGLR